MGFVDGGAGPVVSGRFDGDGGSGHGAAALILDVAADRPGDLRQRRRRPIEHRQAHDQPS